MLKPTLFAAIICLAVPPVGAQSEAERIALLEKQIDAMTTQLVALKAQNEALLAQLAGIRSILDAGPASINTQADTVTDSELAYCNERLADLRGRRDELSTLGYTANHPDMTNLTARIKTVSEECDALVAAKSR